MPACLTCGHKEAENRLYPMLPDGTYFCNNHRGEEYHKRAEFFDGESYSEYINRTKAAWHPKDTEAELAALRATVARLEAENARYREDNERLFGLVHDAYKLLRYQSEPGKQSHREWLKPDYELIQRLGIYLQDTTADAALSTGEGGEG